MRSSLLQKISRFDADHRLLIALLAAVVAGFLVPANADKAVPVTIVWVVYAVTVLLLMWTTIFMVHPRELPQLSRLEDSSRLLILLFVMVAAVASLFAVVYLLNSMNAGNRPQRVTLAILAVASAWTLVHTTFTLRYAHLYYGDDRKQAKRPGGLDFPHESEPDYLDFAYFSFVIGMTSQVSDVAVGSKSMRRTALVHGVLSFLFNTVIIALTVGGISGKL